MAMFAIANPLLSTGLAPSDLLGDFVVKLRPLCVAPVQVFFDPLPRHFLGILAVAGD
jgi:hypothetical protein